MRRGSVLWDTHRSIEDSESFLSFTMEGYERGDFGSWGVVLKDSGAFVGTCGMDGGYAPEHARAEIGYALSREHRGKGLMPEAVRAVIRFGFVRMGLNRIQARCIAENTASARVRILSLQPIVNAYERAQDFENHRQGIIDSLSPEGGME